MIRLTKNEKKMINLTVKSYANYLKYMNIYDYGVAAGKYISAYKDQCMLLKAIDIDVSIGEHTAHYNENLCYVRIIKANEMVFYRRIDFIKIMTGDISSIFEDD